MTRSADSTKGRILQAPTSYFIERALHVSVSISSPRKAGVTKRTLYYHFKSKDHC